MRRLFRRPAAGQQASAIRPAASLGGGRRVYAIGDVHGRLDLLNALLEAILDDCARRGLGVDPSFVMLGDLVDRGPDSAGVVDLVARLSATMPNFTCLMGNHEEVFGMALRGEPGALAFFLRIGGRETLLSYGVEAALLDEGDEQAVLARMGECVPDDHCHFLFGLRDQCRVGDYLFVHAGVKPGVPIDRQHSGDMRWIREPFLTSTADHGAIVVHGHSITQQVDEWPNRIGIDTGAYLTGRLTALCLEGAERWYLTT